MEPVGTKKTVGQQKSEPGAVATGSLGSEEKNPVTTVPGSDKNAAAMSAYRIIGEPDIESAKQLASEDRYQFQWWALSHRLAFDLE